MNNVKSSIAKTLAIVFILVLFLFAFTWIIFDFQKSNTSLKDTWSIVSSLFGGIATLAAAYIASLLFVDWKAQHNATILAHEARNLHKNVNTLRKLVAEYKAAVDNVAKNILSKERIFQEFTNLDLFLIKNIVDIVDFHLLSKQATPLFNHVDNINNKIEIHRNLLHLYEIGAIPITHMQINAANLHNDLNNEVNAINSHLLDFIFLK